MHKSDLIRRAHAIERKIEIVLHTNCTIMNALLPNATAAAFSRSCNCPAAKQRPNMLIRGTAKRPSIVGSLLLNYHRGSLQDCWLQLLLYYIINSV